MGAQQCMSSTNSTQRRDGAPGTKSDWKHKKNQKGQRSKHKSSKGEGIS